MDKNTATTPPEQAPAATRDVRESGDEPGSKTPSGSVTPREIGGRGGLDPVRYGDWEKDGRCIDF